eukprot:9770516-Lingulodinium_polyedra.AAC.1
MLLDGSIAREWAEAVWPVPGSPKEWYVERPATSDCLPESEDEAKADDFVTIVHHIVFCDEFVRAWKEGGHSGVGPTQLIVYSR